MPRNHIGCPFILYPALLLWLTLVSPALAQESATDVRAKLHSR
jgi:hypothetical protein